jgi:putative ABC transport system permease protein
MNSIIFASFLRSLVRHRQYAVLSIGGLAVGIAVCLVVILYVRFETSFDAWLPNHREIYVLEETTDLDRLGLLMGPPMALIDVASREIPGLAAARTMDLTTTVIRNGLGYEQRMLRVDRNFFDVVALPVERGDARRALTSPNGLLITQRMARKYFGDRDALGKVLTLAVSGRKASYEIGAILKDPPANSDMIVKFDLITALIVPIDSATPYYDAFHNWSSQGPPPFFRIATPAAARRLEVRLARLLGREHKRVSGSAGTHGPLHLRPLASLHFLEPGASLIVTTLGSIGILTLLIAVVNYINLSTARAFLRAPEVALCKALGANRLTLFRQYVGESLLTCSIAAFLGLSLVEISLPVVNQAADLDLRLNYLTPDGILLPLALLTILVGGCAGGYPAWALSRWPAAAMLASARTGRSERAGARVREGLVVVQFALAITFVITAAVLIAQSRHAATHDLGYDREGLLIIPSLASKTLDAMQRARLIDRFGALTAVSGVAQSTTAPGGSGVVTSTNVKIPGTAGAGPAFQFFVGTRSFLNVVGARVLAGHLFEVSQRGDPCARTASQSLGTVVINQSGARALHFATAAAAIGKTVGGDSPRTIIGVVEDMRFVSPREMIQPTLYECQRRDPSLAVGLLRFTGSQAAILDQVNRIWLETAPEVPFRAATADAQLRALRKADDRAARLFAIGSALALVIAFVGLWGLAAFNTARRAREIGIRRSLGASSRDIVRLLVAQFIRPVLLANLFAWPLAYAAMRTWLAGFDDRIALSPLFFLFGTATALTIAIVTVLGQSFRAARDAPARTLRHD